MTNLESFGSIRHYKLLILRVKDDKILWRKVSNILNNLRRDLRPWQVVDRTNQLREGEKYAIQALRDTKLPRDVKIYMITGMMSEFGFTFENA
jgi:hypothetical protein